MLWVFFCFPFCICMDLSLVWGYFLYNIIKELFLAIDLMFFFLFYTYCSKVWSLHGVPYVLDVPMLCSSIFLFSSLSSRFSTLSSNLALLSSAWFILLVSGIWSFPNPSSFQLVFFSVFLYVHWNQVFNPELSLVLHSGMHLYILGHHLAFIVITFGFNEVLFVYILNSFILW